MEKYLFSDLVMESAAIKRTFSAKGSGVSYSSEVKGGIEICRLKVCDENEKKRFGVGIGTYVTLYTKSLTSYSNYEADEIAQMLSQELINMINTLVKSDGRALSVLVAGLGNRDVTSDSLGVRVADSVNVTRHVLKLNNSAFSNMYSNSIASVICGVLGKNGIESLEVLQGIVSQVSPDIIIAIDALAAREYERLGAVIQVSDAGIVPGAGIGNRRDEISLKTIGVPVISIGVPTVVSAATFVCDSLQKIGYSRLEKCMREHLDELGSFFVTPKDCDMLLKASAKIISCAIEYALL